MGKEMFFTGNIVGTEAYYDIGKFYVSHNGYQEAQPYLGKALKFENVPAPLKKDLNYWQFKTDSASGDFVSAIQHYQRSVFLKDSLLAGEVLKNQFPESAIRDGGTGKKHQAAGEGGTIAKKKAAAIGRNYECGPAPP